MTGTEDRPTVGGHAIAVQCPRCLHGFRHVTGTLDPKEGTCPHEWRDAPERGVAGGVECANCGLFLGAHSVAITGMSKRFATSFMLGRDDDEDPRPCVSVGRQWGSTLYPVKPWVVYDVLAEGVVSDSKREFDSQEAALIFGWLRLEKLRMEQG